MRTYCQEIAAHYASTWSNTPEEKRWGKGPLSELPPSFRVLEFRPTEIRGCWTYATCCMSQPDDAAPLELHLFSPVQTEDHVELLTVVAHYHQTGTKLALGHTVNFGRPWLPNSLCEYGLISLPYLDGPRLEHFYTDDKSSVRFLWLLPITQTERDYKKSFGLEELEQRFDAASVDYLNPNRQSAV
jgi:Suppressor of fused protein (SUFU)